ncbi:MAG: hypothetical protein V1735_02090 [Nanoarchaeota archaeon]
MILLLRCPHCGHDQKYLTATMLLREKRRRCVYCGRSFGVADHIVKNCP